MVSPALQTFLKEALEVRGISYDVMIDDVQAVADSQMHRDVSISAASFDYTIYHTYAEVSIVKVNPFNMWWPGFREKIACNVLFRPNVFFVTFTTEEQ